MRARGILPHYFDQEEKVPDLRVLFQDSHGRLWVGQKGLYLLDAARDRFQLYPNRAGLANEFIKGIVEDGAGILWISSSNGLTRLDPQTRGVKKFNTGDGLQDQEFEANAFLKTRDGELFFGGIKGSIVFIPGRSWPMGLFRRCILRVSDLESQGGSGWEYQFGERDPAFLPAVDLFFYFFRAELYYPREQSICLSDGGVGYRLELCWYGRTRLCIPILARGVIGSG